MEHKDGDERPIADERTPDAEQLLQSCIEGAGDAVIFAVAADYTYLCFNHNFIQIMMSAYGTSVVRGGNHLEGITREEDRRKTKTNIDRALHGERHTVVQDYGAEGRSYFEIYYTPIPGASGGVSGVTVVATNITKRLAATNALHRSEERFNAFMDASPALAWVKDTEGRLVYVNKAWEAAYGRTREEVIGKSPYEIFPLEVAERLRKTDIEAQLSHAPYLISEDDFTIGARTFHFQSHKFHFTTATGQRWMGGIAIDISRRKEAESSLAARDAVLKEHATRLEFAMQASLMAWWELDVKTGAVTFNEAKARMLGYAPERFTHYRDFTALLHPGDYDPVMNAMGAHLRGETDSYVIEFRILTKQDGYRWFRDFGKIVQRDSHGAPLKVTGIVIDITESKNKEHRAAVQAPVDRGLHL